jgi:hypothetical protein
MINVATQMIIETLVFFMIFLCPAVGYCTKKSKPAFQFSDFKAAAG